MNVDIVNHQTVKHWHDPLGNLFAVTGKQTGNEEERVELTRQSSIDSENPQDPSKRIFESDSKNG